jgi:hypothetical protein
MGKANQPREATKARVQSTALGQGGRVARWQLLACGLPSSTADSWIAGGWLIPTRRGVYAIGALVRTELTDLWDAILYAGPGAMLSHGTAGHWRGLLRYPPRDGIHVSTPRRVASIKGVHVHARRHLARDTHNGLPVTDPTQTVLDIASVESARATRYALAQLDFDKALDLDALWDATGRGCLGTARLRAAIALHNPEYGRLHEGVEVNFFELLESVHFDPMPEVSVELEPGLTVDFYFRRHGVVVETDGADNHDSDEQQLEDARRDLRCRQRGLQVIRYRRAQLLHEPGVVLADLSGQLDAQALTRGIAAARYDDAGNVSYRSS